MGCFFENVVLYCVCGIYGRPVGDVRPNRHFGVAWRPEPPTHKNTRRGRRLDDPYPRCTKGFVQYEHTKDAIVRFFSSFLCRQKNDALRRLAVLLALRSVHFANAKPQTTHPNRRLRHRLAVLLAHRSVHFANAKPQTPPSELYI